jgi:hypothetical protein
MGNVRRMGDLPAELVLGRGLFVISVRTFLSWSPADRAKWGFSIHFVEILEFPVRNNAFRG